MSSYIQNVNVTDGTVVIRFSVSIKASTIINSRFTLWENHATPIPYESDPFKSINLSTDYNSINRTLTLAWRSGVLQPDTEYQLRISGLQNAAGTTLQDKAIQFTTDDDTTPTEEELPPTSPGISIVDFSVVPDAFSSSDDSSLEGFRVLESDPANGDYYLEEDYNNGVVVIKFNERPSLQYVNSEYFKVQRKPIQRRPSRWEKLDVAVFADAMNPWVHVSFPSNDEPQVYGVEGHTYFEDNMKYRIIVSKELMS